MTESEKLFLQIIKELPNGIEGKMFGAKCPSNQLKVKRQPFSGKKIWFLSLIKKHKEEH